MNLCDYGCCPREVRDWFCGAGGAAMGLHRAWPHAHIVGYDVKPMPRYPFDFVQGDALEAHCHQMAFLGLSDSFEAYYQLIRRCWRFGQRMPVDVLIVISDAEGRVVENVRAARKVTTK